MKPRGGVAQLVEQRTHKPRVPRSIRGTATNPSSSLWLLYSCTGKLPNLLQLLSQVTPNRVPEIITPVIGDCGRNLAKSRGLWDEDEPYRADLARFA